MNDETERRKKAKLSKVGLILGINFAGILAIFLFYIQFNGNPTIKIKSATTVGDFQIYISSPKNDYLIGDPLDLKVYLTNLSSEYKNFEIYAFSLRITNNSTKVYVFNNSNVIKSQISPKGTILIYETKDQPNFTHGDYFARVLMNLDGKAVSLEKSFKYISDLSPTLVCSDDFIVDGQKEMASLYIKNNTLKTLKFNVQKIIFSLLNEKNQILTMDTVTLNSTLTIPSYKQSLVYDYQTKPVQNPGDYKLVSEIIGTRDMMATDVISVINKDGVNDTTGIKITSDMPSHARSDVPIPFSVFLLNGSLQKKYIIVDSLTVIIKKGNAVIYKFSSQVPRNVRVDASGKIAIFNSSASHMLTFPENGMYDFQVITKIGNNFINYDKQIQSS